MKKFLRMAERGAVINDFHKGIKIKVVSVEIKGVFVFREIDGEKTAPGHYPFYFAVKIIGGNADGSAGGGIFGPFINFRKKALEFGNKGINFFFGKVSVFTFRVIYNKFVYIFCVACFGFPSFKVILSAEFSVIGEKFIDDAIGRAGNSFRKKSVIYFFGFFRRRRCFGAFFGRRSCIFGNGDFGNSLF